MGTVASSPKHQVRIPSWAGNRLGVVPGQKVQMIVYEGRIVRIPLEQITEARGFHRGIDTTVTRQPDRPGTSLTPVAGKTDEIPTPSAG